MIQRLLRDVSPERFFQSYWERRPLHLKGAPAAVRELLGRPFGSADLPRLIHVSSHLSKCDVRLVGFFNREKQLEGADHLFRIGCSDTREFWNLVQGGHTAALYNIQNIDEGLAAVLLKLREELGWLGHLHASLWYSPPGAQVTPHLDETATFQLQLEGRKRWRIGRDVAVPHPRSSERLQSDRMAEVSADGWERRTEQVARDALVDLVMEPGDLLYMPAGVWHATEALGPEPSLALAMVLSPARIRDVLEVLLDNAFEGDLQWRSPVPPSAVTGQVPERAVSFLRGRLEEARAYFQQLTPESLELNRAIKAVSSRSSGGGECLKAPPRETRAPLSPEARLALPVDAPVTGALGHEPDGSPRLYLHYRSEEVCFEDPRFFPFARALLAHSEFLARQACDWAEAGERYLWEEVRPLLEALLDLRILEARRGPSWPLPENGLRFGGEGT